MSCRVLVVDDNSALAENVAELLQLAGHRPVTFGDPRQAIVWARRHGFDVALIDLCMPGMDGATVRAELAATEPDASYVLLTAYDGGNVEGTVKHGFDAVWSKPIPLSELMMLLAWRARPGPARARPGRRSKRVLAHASGDALTARPDDGTEADEA